MDGQRGEGGNAYFNSGLLAICVCKGRFERTSEISRKKRKGGRKKRGRGRKRSYGWMNKKTSVIVSIAIVVSRCNMRMEGSFGRKAEKERERE